jgi:hypothetical protein
MYIAAFVQSKLSSTRSNLLVWWPGQHVILRNLPCIFKNNPQSYPKSPQVTTIYHSVTICHNSSAGPTRAQLVIIGLFLHLKRRASADGLCDKFASRIIWLHEELVEYWAQTVEGWNRVDYFGKWLWQAFLKTAVSQILHCNIAFEYYGKTFVNDIVTAGKKF